LRAWDRRGKLFCRLLRKTAAAEKATKPSRRKQRTPRRGNNEPTSRNNEPRKLAAKTPRELGVRPGRTSELGIPSPPHTARILIPNCVRDLPRADRPPSIILEVHADASDVAYDCGAPSVVLGRQHPAIAQDPGQRTVSPLKEGKASGVYKVADQEVTVVRGPANEKFGNEDCVKVDTMVGRAGEGQRTLTT